MRGTVLVLLTMMIVVAVFCLIPGFLGGDKITYKPAAVSPWVRAGEEIWQGTSQNSIVTIKLIATEDVALHSTSNINTEIRISAVKYGYMILTLKESPIPGAFIQTASLSFRVRNNTDGKISYDGLVLPERVFLDKYAVFIGIPEIQINPG